MDFGLKTSWTIASEDGYGKVDVEKITVPRALMDMLPKVRKACREFSKALLAHKKRVEAALTNWKKNSRKEPKPSLYPAQQKADQSAERACQSNAACREHTFRLAVETG